MQMIVKTIDFENANDFLNILAIEGPCSGFHYSDFVFRGVAIGNGDNEHKLIPTALRLESFQDLMHLSGSSSSSSEEFIKTASKGEWVQARAESKILGAFFRHADAQGLPMSEITSTIRQFMQSPRTSDALFNYVVQNHLVWPPNDLLPLAAQAQHYGLPTRLLDWSSDPWVAAYFATKGALEMSQNRDVPGVKLAVWILNRGLLEDEKRLARDEQPMVIPLSCVTAPANSNPNLRAQRGVFTVWRPRFQNGHRQQVDRKPLDQQLSDLFHGIDIGSPLLYKLTLPYEKVPLLWKAIKYNGVNAARLFPDFSGAASSVREEVTFK